MRRIQKLRQLVLAPAGFCLAALIMSLGNPAPLGAAQQADAKPTPPDEVDYSAELPRIPGKSPAEAMKAFAVIPPIRVLFQK